jgi:hypothetical protein
MQHSASEQAGVPLNAQQSPAAGSPQTCAMALVVTKAEAAVIQVKDHFIERIGNTPSLGFRHDAELEGRGRCSLDERQTIPVARRREDRTV